MRNILDGQAVILLGLVIGVGVLASGTSYGQEKHKISWSSKPGNTKFTVNQRLEHPDIRGHVVALIELRRMWPDGGGPVIEAQKVTEEIIRGFYDGVAGNGDNWGYSVWRFESGDLAFGQWRNTVQSVINPDRSRKATYVGTYVTTGGTGKLKGIKGVGRFSGLGEFDPEGKPTRNEYSAEGEYWFEK